MESDVLQKAMVAATDPVSHLQVKVRQVGVRVVVVVVVVGWV